MPTLSIIIPAYNEENTICEVLEKVRNVTLIADIKKEVIIVDDCSVDNTTKLVKKFITVNSGVNIKYIKLEKNRGKGYAVRTGIDKVTGDVIIIQDADLEYNPEDYNVLLPFILSGEYKAVYGSRVLNKENSYSYKTFYWGGRLVSFVVGLLYSQKLTDEPTCYKMFHASLLKSIPLTSDRFGFCPEVTAKVLRGGYKIKEVPIHYSPRLVKDGKKIKWYDGIEAVWLLLRYRFQPDIMKNKSKELRQKEAIRIRRVILYNALGAIIACATIYFSFTGIKEYKWVYKNLLFDNFMYAKRNKHLSMDQRRESKLGSSFIYLQELKKSTPEDAVILMPQKEAYYPKGQKGFEHEIHNKLFRLRVLYPRKIVDADEGLQHYVNQVTHLAIVNGYGYEWFHVEPDDKAPFAVFPVKQ